MIVVIDYDVGNVKSVCNALGFIGCGVKLSRKPEDIENAGGLILPGVFTVLKWVFILPGKV